MNMYKWITTLGKLSIWGRAEYINGNNKRKVTQCL